LQSSSDGFEAPCGGFVSPKIARGGTAGFQCSLCDPLNSLRFSSGVRFGRLTRQNQTVALFRQTREAQTREAPDRLRPSDRTIESILFFIRSSFRQIDPLEPGFSAVALFRRNGSHPPPFVEDRCLSYRPIPIMSTDQPSPRTGRLDGLEDVDEAPANPTRGTRRRRWTASKKCGPAASPIRCEDGRGGSAKSLASQRPRTEILPARLSGAGTNQRARDAQVATGTTGIPPGMPGNTLFGYCAFDLERNRRAGRIGAPPKRYRRVLRHGR